MICCVISWEESRRRSYELGSGTRPVTPESPIQTIFYETSVECPAF